MILSNSNLRKAIWSIGFGLFCLLLSGLYSFFIHQRRRTVIGIEGKKIFSYSSVDIIFFLIISVLAGIRLNVGSDYFNYFNRFNAVDSKLSFLEEILPSFDGYTWLSYFVKRITNNEYAIFGAIAVILYGYCFHNIDSEVEDKSAGFICYLFLGFFANSLNILKQCISMIFVFSFYKAFYKKNYIKSFVFAIFAFAFHYSSIFALLFIGFITIIKLEPSKRMFRISVLSGILIAMFLPQLLSLLIRLVPSASGYDVYINWRRNNQIRLVLAVTGMSIMYFILIFFILKNKNVLKQFSKQRYYEITFLIIGLCINIASIRVWVVQRIALYFYQFIILILPTLFQWMPSDKAVKCKRVLYAIMFIYLIFSGIFWGENEYYSYNTIFSGDKPIYDADFNKMFQ